MGLLERCQASWDILMGNFPTEYYTNGWPEGGVAICVEASFFEKVDSKVAHNINA